MNTDRPHMSIDNPVFCLAQLCRDKLNESFQLTFARANCTITDRNLSTWGGKRGNLYNSGFYIELRIQKTTIFRRLLSQSGRWIMTVRFFEDHATIFDVYSKSGLLFGFPSDDLNREVPYSDPNLMDILLSEMRLAW